MTSTADSTRGIAVVTGASSGIGAATARRLAKEGYTVVCAARRTDRIEALATEISGHAVTCDVTDPASVAALAGYVAELGAPLTALINNAGGAFGSDRVEDGDPEQWRAMFEANVIGTLQVTKALLPALRASGNAIVVNMGSIAGRVAYEGGAGYTAAKHGVKVMTETMRLELNGEPIRITEVAPGMVQTEEFSLVRFAGDQARADAVYAGVDEPLVADDIADAVAWIVTRPGHVNVDEIVLKPVAQAAPYKVHRRS